jgi:ABC-type nickel/cobalt efflux system permease component RcnA
MEGIQMSIRFVALNMRLPRFPLTALFAALALVQSAAAHPMGNLSVNHYARLEPGARGVSVTYVLDLAEIPTFELLQSWNATKDAPKSVLEAKAAGQARAWVENVSLTESGKKLQAKIEGTELAVLDGAGNLPVFRITTKLRVAVAGGRFEYEDHNYPTRAGWREIVIRPAAGADVSKASRGDVDVSQALTSYPQDPMKAPPQDSRAWFEWTPVSSVTEVRKPVVVADPAPVAAVTPAPAAEPGRDVRTPEAQSSGSVKRNDAISRILRLKEISWPLMATLLGLAFWFGAMHALEPGHGKTMVAAYLVGERGTAKHAVILGSMVTFTHTISVFILGIATMFLSRYIVAERISKVLGVISGLTIVWIGAMMLWRRYRSLSHSQGHHHHDHGHTHEHAHAHAHSHDHGHSHDHAHSHSHEHQHTHAGHTHSHVPEGDISIGSLIALGASGGLVPCPSALILLLSAISIGRVGLGMVLLLAFSLGLAIVLTATGLLVLYAKNLFPERKPEHSAFFRYMPVFSAAVIVIIGVVMTSVSLGWIPTNRFIG